MYYLLWFCSLPWKSEPRYLLRRDRRTHDTAPTATSHFTLAVMALTGTLVHIATGSFHHGLRRTIALGLGVLLGAQFGARFSHHVHGQWILRSLAVALGLVGIRILVLAFA